MKIFIFKNPTHSSSADKSPDVTVISDYYLYNSPYVGVVVVLIFSENRINHYIPKIWICQKSFDFILNFDIQKRQSFCDIIPFSLIQVSIPHIVRFEDPDLSKPQCRERWHIHILRSEATQL